jgi:hypothetical protein
MESIHKTTGKKFTGRFAELAVKIGLAKEIEEETTEKTAEVEEVKKVKRTRKTKK